MSTALPTATNANIQASTRDLWLKTYQSQVWRRTPLMARLWDGNRVVTRGGKSIVRPVDKAEADTLAQPYAANDPLNSGSKTYLDNPYFLWKYINMPITYGLEEEIQNDGDPAAIDLVPFLVKKAQRGIRLALYQHMWGIDPASTTILATTDAGKHFQSVRQALKHDATYGHLARATTTTNQFWQGGSIAASWADQSTAYTPSIDTFRKAVTAVQEFVEDTNDYLCVVGPAIFRQLQSQVEARRMDVSNSTPLAKYGFSTLRIDGIEVVSDPWLTAGHVSDGATIMALLKISSWEVRISPKRNFKFTGFTWQGDVPNGVDQWLARILLAGNMVCWQPNANIMLLNVA